MYFAADCRLFSFNPVLSFSLSACFAGCSITSIALGVGNKPDSISSMGSVDGRSWKYNRLNGVPFILQVSLHLVEDHPSIPINNAVNVFSHDPSWFNLCNRSTHLRPEMALVFLPQSFACL